jgi:hypothetical protein
MDASALRLQGLNDHAIRNILDYGGDFAAE